MLPQKCAIHVTCECVALGGGLCKWDGRETWSAEHRNGELSANRVIFEADYKHHYCCNILLWQS